MGDRAQPHGRGEGLPSGSEVGGYRIERLLGRGGMGAVYEATQLSLQRRVALKVIAPRLSADEAFRARFRREARAAAAVEHPNLLPIHEAGELPEGALFIAMRLVDGGDLESRLRAIGPLGAGEALPLLGQLADALDGAHAAGLIHRDVKPANVLLEQRRGGVHAYLTDFGLVKDVESSTLGHTDTGQLLGTVDYMAPEQIAGEDYGAGVDVYAFGALAYRALTGSVPYRRETVAATLVAHREAPIPVASERSPGLPPAFDRLVGRAMAKDPDWRARSAGELMRELAEQLSAGAEEAVRPDESPTVADGPQSTARADAPPQTTPTRAIESDGGKPSLIRQTVIYAAAFTPIWVVAYIIGRNL